MDIATETSPPAPPTVPLEIATRPSLDEQYAGASSTDSVDVTSSATPDHNDMTNDWSTSVFS